MFNVKTDNLIASGEISTDYEDFKLKVMSDPLRASNVRNKEAELNLVQDLVVTGEHTGVTHEMIAERSGLSLRTVKRIERFPFSYTPRTLNRFLGAIDPEAKLGFSISTKKPNS